MSALDIGLLVSACALALLVGVQVYKLVRSIKHRRKRDKSDDIDLRKEEEHDRH